LVVVVVGSVVVVVMTVVVVGSAVVVVTAVVVVVVGWVLGSAVGGAAVLGAAVVGGTVVGAAVVGAAVVGAAVVGAAVVGGRVVVTRRSVVTGAGWVVDVDDTRVGPSTSSEVGEVNGTRVVEGLVVDVVVVDSVLTVLRTRSNSSLATGFSPNQIKALAALRTATKLHPSAAPGAA